MSKKLPDNIVYNEETDKFDAKIKRYPTTIGSQNFHIINVDKSDALKAENYFNKRLIEIKKEYEKLINEYDSTKLIYNTKYSFQPLVGEVYYIYKSKSDTFLSLIKPNEWNKEFLGAYRLNTNGTWEKVNYEHT